MVGLWPSFTETSPVVLEKKKKCEMFRDRQNRWTDKKQTDRRQTIGDKISLLEYSIAIVSYFGQFICEFLI